MTHTNMKATQHSKPLML